ncbi:MAG: hypothetical protein JW795_22065 [Chitinivibrionales bacterium]|nr:hypothetical protein [Chitinivibrionales bacterium]
MNKDELKAFDSGDSAAGRLFLESIGGYIRFVVRKVVSGNKKIKIDDDFNDVILYVFANKGKIIDSFKGDSSSFIAYLHTICRRYALKITLRERNHLKMHSKMEQYHSNTGHNPCADLRVTISNTNIQAVKITSEWLSPAPAFAMRRLESEHTSFYKKAGNYTSNGEPKLSSADPNVSFVRYLKYESTEFFVQAPINADVYLTQKAFLRFSMDLGSMEFWNYNLKRQSQTQTMIQKFSIKGTLAKLDESYCRIPDL